MGAIGAGVAVAAVGALGVAGAVGAAAAVGTGVAVGTGIVAGTLAGNGGGDIGGDGGEFVGDGGGNGGGEFVNFGGDDHLVQCDEVCNPECLADSSHAGKPLSKFYSMNTYMFCARTVLFCEWHDV